VIYWLTQTTLWAACYYTTCSSHCKEEEALLAYLSSDAEKAGICLMASCMDNRCNWNEKVYTTVYIKIIIAWTEDVIWISHEILIRNCKDNGFFRINAW
jgi:hypothetical protein